MEIAVKVIAWTLGTAVTGGVAYLFFVALRWPVRIWRHGERRRAILVGVGVTLGLLVWVGLSFVVP
jgi:hypothetical protein